MREFAPKLLASAVLHGLLFASLAQLPERARPTTASPRVEVKIVEPPPPPLPPLPPKEEKIVEAPKKPAPAPKVPVKRGKPKPKPKKAPTKQPKPKPKPKGFSVDMSNTVATGKGPSVAAKVGGGNMFADPDDKSLEPGDKAATRPEPRASHGQGGSEPVVTMPVLLSTGNDLKPPYPPKARKLGIEGIVRLRLFISSAGKVEKVRLVKKLGHGLDAAAIRHARSRWRFKPATEDGVAVAMWVPFAVRFELER